MTQFLPPNLLALFAARDPIPYLPPVERLSHEKRTVGYGGIGEFVKFFETGPPPPKVKVETKEEKQDRKRKEKQEQISYKLEQDIALWNPSSYEKATSDPYKTLFVGRINYDTTESKLRREFESHGPVKKIILVKEKKASKPRGYAFVEYENERDMQSAYKHADGKKIDGKRVLVDIERGRTVKGWLPRRLGGGLGGTRRGGSDVNVKISGREDPDRDRYRDEKRDDSSRRDRRRSRDRSLSRERRRRNSRERSEKVERVPRDRERKRRRSRDDEERDKRRRSKSRDRKKHRSRSKEREKERRKEKKEKHRERDRDKERHKLKEEDDFDKVRIKDEPIDDYPDYDNYDYSNNYNPAFIKSET